MPMIGGVGNTKPADETVREVFSAILAEVKSKILEKRSGSSPQFFEPISYKTQLVAGTNFFVKVKLEDDEFVHVRIYRNLQRAVTLHSISDKKAEHDEIEYF